jgi:hypothetical protein
MKLKRFTNWIEDLPQPIYYLVVGLTAALGAWLLVLIVYLFVKLIHII